MMDTRRWGPGERIVFEPYTKEVYEETFKWIVDHGIFADSGMGSGNYEDAVIAAALARRAQLARTAKYVPGESLAVSIPRTEPAVMIRHFPGAYSIALCYSSSQAYA
jgi:hypothetical protein